MTTIAITTITYNSEAYIERCIQSVKDQSITPSEYIVVDGASQDNTGEIIKKHIDGKVVTNFMSAPDRGISHAFNRAWRMANSDFVVVLNSDDWLEPNHIAEFLNIIEQDDPDIIIPQLSFDNQNNSKLIRPKIFENWPPKKWFHPSINHAGMAIRKNKLLEINGYDEAFSIAMDVDLFYRLLERNPKIVICSTVTSHQSDGGVSQQQQLKALKEMCEIEIKFGRPMIFAKSAFLWRLTKSIIKNICSGILQKHASS